MKWKGVDISTKGLVALTQPVPKKAKKKTDLYTIDGSDKTDVVTRGYEPYYLEVKMMCENPANVSSALAFLDGSGALISDDDATLYWNAEIVDEVEFPRMFKGTSIREGDVRFLVTDPFRYLVGETATTLVASGNVTNQGTVNSLPSINIIGTGIVTITIDGRSFSYNFDTASVDIDSFSQRAYSGATEKTSRMTGDFPYLTPGVNAVSWTGSVVQLVITPRSRYL